MVLDKNCYCPGGTNKKIKHCACQDIMGELDRIITAIQGEQRVAALDRINRTLATKANRPCLLSLKITVLQGMKDLQALEDTVTTFVKVAPDNALAHTFAAQLELRKNRVREAVDEVQTAWSHVKGILPSELADTFADVADALAGRGEYLAARAHLMTRALLDPDNTEFRRLLLSLLSTAHIPAILKRNLTFADCPAGATWKGRFDAAYRECVMSRWKRGLEKYEKLNQDFPDQPAILYNIAMARSCLALPRLSEVWHAYAMCPGVEYSQAVEAEALAQILAGDADLASATVVKWTISIQDANALNENLLSSRRFVAMNGDMSGFRAGDAPPPKSAFLLIDKPLPDASVELTADTVPRALTHVVLFGRETDRAARVEMVVPKTDVMQQVRSALAEVAGEQVTSEESEEIIDTVQRLPFLVKPMCVFPDAAPYAARQRAYEELVQRNVAEQWADIPLAALDDKTPRQVVGDPAYRVPLAGALAALEQTAEVLQWPIDVDVLRAQLEVPIPEPIDPEPETISDVSPADLVRVRAERLTDEDLLLMFERAAICHLQKAIVRLGEEVLRRESVADTVDRAAVHATIAEQTPTSDKAIEHLGEAQRIAVANGASPARYMLKELPLRLVRKESKEATGLLQRIQSRHLQEPGISEGLYNILVQFGLIRPDGQTVGAPRTPEAAEPAAATSQVWTPGDPPAAADEKKPSQLWIPD